MTEEQPTKAPEGAPAPTAPEQTEVKEDRTPAEAAAPAETPAMPAVKGNKQDNMMAAVSYIGPLFLLTMIARPKNKYCMFHARQSAVLFGVGFIVLIFGSLLSALGTLIGSLGLLLMLALAAVYFLAIFKAYSGEEWKIPVVSDFASKIDVEKLFGKFGTSMSGIKGMTEGEKAETPAASDADAAAVAPDAAAPEAPKGEAKNEPEAPKV